MVSSNRMDTVSSNSIIRMATNNSSRTPPITSISHISSSSISSTTEDGCKSETQTQLGLQDTQEGKNDDSSDRTSTTDENSNNDDKDDKDSEGAAEANKVGRAAATGVQDADQDAVADCLVAVAQTARGFP